MTDRWNPPARHDAPSPDRRRRTAIVVSVVALLVALTGAALLALSATSNGRVAAAAPTTATTKSMTTAPTTTAPPTTAPTSTAPPVVQTVTHTPPATRPPAPLGLSAVTSGPGSFVGECPTRLQFDSTITATRAPGDLSYRWVSDSGAEATVTTRLDTTSTVLHLSRPVSTSASGWEALQILSPVEFTSAHAPYTAACAAASVDAVTVSPAAHTGACGARGVTYTISATITVQNGPAALTYHWLRSDGPGPVQPTLFFGPGTSSQRVTTTWTLYDGATPTGLRNLWEKVQVDSPGAVTSDPAQFALWCV